VPVNIRPVIGGHRGLSLIVANVIRNAPSVISSVLRVALSEMLRGTLKPISFIAKDVAFVPLNAGEKQ